jgi:hypothetical protein
MTSKRAAAIDPNNLKQKNAGKVQFNAVREEVSALLDKGYSRRALYAVLHEQGVFTGSYRRFCEYVQGIEKRKRGKPELEPSANAAAATPPAAPEPPVHTAPQSVKPAAGGFVHTNTPNINDLI